MATRGDDVNVLRMPKSIALTLILLLCGGAANWARQEERSAHAAALAAEQTRQIAEMSRKVERIERSVAFSRADAESMRAEIMAKLNSESRHTRNTFREQLEDLEQQINQVRRTQTPISRRRMP
jgi:hypothetical protein